MVDAPGWLEGELELGWAWLDVGMDVSGKEMAAMLTTPPAMMLLLSWLKPFS
jgi:hypothetical protein